MLKKLLPALCCAALAAGCASTATTGSSAEPLPGEKPAQLADRSFMWVDGASEDCELPPSIRFGADGRISGQAGCNRMLGSWKQDGKTIDLGQIAHDDALMRSRLHGSREEIPQPSRSGQVHHGGCRRRGHCALERQGREAR